MSQPRFCSACGSPRSPQARFCLGCGRRFVPPAAPTAPLPPPSLTRSRRLGRLTRRLAGCLIALIGLIIGWRVVSAIRTPAAGAGRTAVPVRRQPAERPTELAERMPPAALPTPAATFGPAPAPGIGAAGQLRVHFIDVGQGDGILLEGPDGATALIDGGYDGDGALEYLRAHGIDRIDAMIVSHPHADHIGGLPAVLDAMPVGAVWTSGASHTTGIFEEFLDAIERNRVPYREVASGDRIPLGGLSLLVLRSAPAAADLNDSSLVLRLEYGEVSWLFTGDAEAPSEQALLAGARERLPATVLKVGHHGSYTSSAPDFVAAVGPAVAVYSAGRGNSYGHPHDETIRTLCAAHVAIYGTDVDGTVVIGSDGTGYAIATERTRRQPDLCP
jgi:competence protein ComEC